jgi:hypothetical protein
MTKNLTDRRGELSDGRAETLPHLLINSLAEKLTDLRKALITNYVIDTYVAGSRRRRLNTASTFLLITNLTHFFQCIYFTSLHVSSNPVLIIRRINCINISPTSSRVIYTR